MKAGKAVSEQYTCQSNTRWETDAFINVFLGMHAHRLVSTAAPNQLPTQNQENNPHGSDNDPNDDVPSCKTANEEDDLTIEFCNFDDDDEIPPTLRQSEATSPPTRSTMPTWLANEYDIARDQLAHQINATGQPECYRRGIFYHGGENSFLQYQSIFRLEPAMFQHYPWFVWLPHVLLGGRIPCPDCRHNHRTRQGKPVLLQSLGWVDKPRRVVDIDHNTFIIGYRYRCVTCHHTYRSWSTSILNVLPRALAAQFTFRLTFRCGLSDQLAALLRDTFRSGMGPEVFTQMIQSFHRRQFDQRHVQYLEMIRDRKDGILGAFHIKSKPFGRFNDRDGYAGYVPRAPYFCRFYDAMVEADEAEMRQHISMLPAKILAIDHSFKVCSLSMASTSLRLLVLTGSKTNGSN